MDYENEAIEDMVFSDRQGPLSPENGHPMMEITENFDDIPDGIEVWECLESRSIYIRTHNSGNFGNVDYTGDEINEIRDITRTIIN